MLQLIVNSSEYREDKVKIGRGSLIWKNKKAKSVELKN